MLSQGMPCSLAVFSGKVLTVIILHWWYAEMREAFNLGSYNYESTTQCGISTSMAINSFEHVQNFITGTVFCEF